MYVCVQLALKHRPNKNQKQRIGTHTLALVYTHPGVRVCVSPVVSSSVCFIGSPVEATEKQLETIGTCAHTDTPHPPHTCVCAGKNLKKNNVALDLISFGRCPSHQTHTHRERERDGTCLCECLVGDTQPNSAKLSKLIATVDSNNNSHLVEVQTHTHTHTRVFAEGQRYTQQRGEEMRCSLVCGCVLAQVPSDRILSDYLLSSPISTHNHNTHTPTHGSISSHTTHTCVSVD